MLTQNQRDIFDRFKQQLENEYNFGQMADIINSPYCISASMQGTMDYAEMERCAGPGPLGERLSKFLVSDARECKVKLQLTSAITSGYADTDVLYQNVMLELEPDIVPSPVYSKDDFCFSIDNQIQVSASDTEYENSLAEVCVPFISPSLGPKP